MTHRSCRPFVFTLLTIFEGLGLCLGATLETLQGGTQLMLLAQGVSMQRRRPKVFQRSRANSLLRPWLTSGRCLSDRGTNLENSSSHSPKHLHLEVHMCQYLHCKIHCSNPTLYTQVSSAAGSLPCWQVMFCGLRELASLQNQSATSHCSACLEKNMLDHDIEGDAAIW